VDVAVPAASIKVGTPEQGWRRPGTVIRRDL